MRSLRSIGLMVTPATLLAGCTHDENQVQADFERLNSFGIRRFHIVMEGVQKGTHFILDCTRVIGSRARTAHDGFDGVLPTYFVAERQNNGALNKPETMLRIEHYDTSNYYYRDTNNVVIPQGSKIPVWDKYPKLPKPQWVINDVKLYTRPTDILIPNNELCQEVDPKVLDKVKG